MIPTLPEDTAQLDARAAHSATQVLSHSHDIAAFAALSARVCVRDRHQWARFLDISRQIHETLDIDPTTSWSGLPPDRKRVCCSRLRQECLRRGNFISSSGDEGSGEDITAALDWRLNQLQTARMARREQSVVRRASGGGRRIVMRTGGEVVGCGGSDLAPRGAGRLAQAMSARRSRPDPVRNDSASSTTAAALEEYGCVF